MRAGLATLVDVLTAHAVESPDKTAVTFLEDGETRSVSWTYADLHRRAAEIASALRRLDLAGRTVLLAHPPGLEFVAALFGCFYAGAIAVPTYPPRFRRDRRTDARLAAVVEDARPAHALTDAAHRDACRLATAAGAAAPPLEWLATDEPPFAERVERADFGAEPDAIAMLQYTSGSTRVPAGVVLSHRNLMENQYAIAEAMGHDEDSRFVSWLPPYHDMGLIGTILQPIALGSDVTLMAPMHALERPIRWLRAISRTGATTSGAPDSMFAHCLRVVSPDERDGLDLRSWRIAFNGSEPVRAETMQRFAAFFAPCGFRADAFYPCYGLAEATLLVSGENGMCVEAFDGGAHLVSCGRPAPGVEVAIVDPETLRARGSGETGEIWLSGASIACGYWNRPEATSATFGNAVPGRPGRFLRTGDLGVVRDGRLFVAGRLKDLVILGGRNTYPQDVEACAGGSHAALSPDRCAAFGVDGPEGERLVVACEMPRDAAPGLDTALLLRGMRDAVAAEMEIAVSAAQILKQGALPRTTSGKIRRGACRQAYLDRTWEVVDEWPASVAPAAVPSSPILDEIAREVTSVLNAPGRLLDPERPLAGQGLDSLGRVELILRLEARFRVAFDPSSISPDATLRDLAAAVGRARSGRSAAPEGSLPGA